MLKSIVKTAAFTFAALTLSTSVHAADGQMDHSKMNHEKMDHGAMQHDAKPGATEATGTGIINSIDAAKKQINVKHDPMPELGWPEMTMDLPVTNKVDLTKIKPGDKVTFHVKLGRDKAYRITEMEVAK